MQKLILLIDDDEEEFFILNQAFQMAGIPSYCMWANSAERAQKLLQEVMPDFVFIDYNMPRVNGIACLEQMRSLSNMRKVPVIIYSNHIDQQVIEQALSKGALSMQKPDSMLKLAKQLINIIGEGKLVYSL
jgi:DNA-binding NtrC family response regulator